MPQAFTLLFEAQLNSYALRQAQGERILYTEN